MRRAPVSFRNSNHCRSIDLNGPQRLGVASLRFRALKLSPISRPSSATLLKIDRRHPSGRVLRFPVFPVYGMNRWTTEDGEESRRYDISIWSVFPNIEVKNENDESPLLPAALYKLELWMYINRTKVPSRSSHHHRNVLSHRT